MKKGISAYLKDYMMLLVLIVLLAVFSVLGPVVAHRQFFNLANLLTMLNQNAYLVILGVGITFIMLGGGMDLSTGFLISTVGVCMALLENSTNLLVALVCGILLAVLLSGFNGVMYSWLRVFPFIITLGTQYVLNGATYLLTGGISKTNYVSTAFKLIGGMNMRIGSGALKTGVLVMIVMVIIGTSMPWAPTPTPWPCPACLWRRCALRSSPWRASSSAWPRSSTSASMAVP